MAVASSEVLVWGQAQISVSALERLTGWYSFWVPVPVGWRVSPFSGFAGGT